MPGLEHIAQGVDTISGQEVLRGGGEGEKEQGKRRRYDRDEKVGEGRENREGKMR